MVSFPFGLFRDKKKSTSTTNPHQTLENFQGMTLSYLRDVRNILSNHPVNRSAIINLSENFYRFYLEFTANENMFRKEGDIYKDYRLFIGLFGSVYDAINTYTRNSKADPDALFKVVDKGIRMIAIKRKPIKTATRSTSQLAAAAK